MEKGGHHLSRMAAISPRARFMILHKKGVTILIQLIDIFPHCIFSVVGYDDECNGANFLISSIIQETLDVDSVTMTD